MTKVLESLSYDEAQKDPTKEKDLSMFHEVVMSAPDINANEFEKVVKKIKAVAKRLSLYASSKDKALMVSKLLRWGPPRAGDSGRGIVTVPGLDSIDVSTTNSDFIGHSYYGDNKLTVADLSVLLTGLEAKRRPRLKLKKNKLDKDYWLFV